MLRFSLLFCFLFLYCNAEAQPQLELVTFATGFDEPVDIVSAGDARLFIVEKDGYIRIIENGQTLATPFLNIDAKINSSASERGLLGLAFHPKYAENGYFFVNYTDNSGNTKIARFRVSDTNTNTADPNSELILLEVNQPFSNHNAGDLAFGPDGYLYIPLGDGGSANDPGNRSQTRTTLLGKMLRIDVDNGNPYRIPPDNPFPDVEGIRPEIWAFGLRNPWRISFDRLTGDLWIGDVGQGNWEEINRQPADSQGGENYGWRCYEGNAAFNTSGCGDQGQYTFPVQVYSHANGACSVTGGFVYRGGDFPNLYGTYIYTDYCNGRIWGLKPDGQGGWINTLLLDGANFDYVAFGEDNEGELYLAGLGSGNIYRVTDAKTTDTSDELQIQKLQLTPNPTSDFLRIQMDVQEPGTYQFRLLDAMARNVKEFQESVGVGFTKQISLKDLAAGVYFLQIQRGQQILTRKIQKN